MESERGDLNRRVPLTDKHTGSLVVFGSRFLYVQPLGGAPGESGRLQHLASRWANPARLHNFFHFEKSSESLLTLDSLRDYLLVFAETKGFEN